MKTIAIESSTIRPPAGYGACARRPMIYFDSCDLATLDIAEPSRTAGACDSRDEAFDGLPCCSVGRGEVIAAFHHHLREQRQTPRVFRDLAAQVEAALATSSWTPLPVTSAVVEAQT